MERLLDVVADRPEGEKVNISALIRAFTPTQAETIAAIQHLITTGKLDGATLRRPTCAEKQIDQKCLTETSVPAPEPETAGPPEPGAAAEEGGAARCVVASPSRPTGAELADRLLAFIELHGLSKSEVSKRLFKSTGHISTLRWFRRPKDKTVERIEAFLAAPPPPELRSRAPLGDQRYSENKPNTAGTSGAHGEGPEPRPEGGLANGPGQQGEWRTPDTAAPDLDAFLTFFRSEWEPLRIPARRWGEGSAHRLRRTAQAMRDRGLLEFRHGEPECRWRLAQPHTEGASGPAREAPSVAESTVAEAETSAVRIEDRAPVEEPVRRRPAPARHPGRDPTQPPELPQTELRDRQITAGHQRAAAVRRGQESEAAARLEAGKEGRNSFERGLMAMLQRRRDEEARLADPVERAKAKLRKKFSPVVNAEVSGGPEGQFYVGRKLVTKAELFAMAEAIAA